VGLSDYKNEWDLLQAWRAQRPRFPVVVPFAEHLTAACAQCRQLACNSLGRGEMTVSGFICDLCIRQLDGDFK